VWKESVLTSEPCALRIMLLRPNSPKSLVMTWIAVALITVLAGLAVLHAYWGLGGRWPGHDDASMVERVVGRTKDMRAPRPGACFAVAAALLISAILVGLHLTRGLNGDVAGIGTVGFWSAAMVFLLRGLAGFAPAVFRYAEGTPFHRLNPIYYSPLCLLIAFAFMACG
jgi:hypothetical protein